MLRVLLALTVWGIGSASLATGSTSSGAGETDHAGTLRPNVAVVITDDQGYGDLSFHGNPILQTPHLDQLAHQSVRLTDFHVAPMCTPTRGQLLSGRDAFRNGAMNVSSGRTLLRPELTTLADIFRRAGYRTGMFGKWHLGDNYPFRPIDRGFEQAVWFPSSHVNAVPDYWDNDYFDDVYIVEPLPSDADGFNPDTSAKRQAFKGYCTEVFFQKSLDWIQQDSNQPFFCYLALNAPHWPHFVPAAYREQLQADLDQHPELRDSVPANQRATLVRFLAMIRCIDEQFGKWMAGLEAAGVADNTIVVFLTDNGSTMGPRYFNAGMRGGKTRLWEGGHRVPAFLRWPAGRLQPGDVGGLCHVQDLLPTLASLADIKNVPADLDGIDLQPVLRRQQEMPDRTLVINYSRMPTFREQYTQQPHLPQKNGAAVLWDRWRLIENRELYDLAEDPKQTQDVAAQNPEVMEKLQRHLDQWWGKVGPTVMEAQHVIIGSKYENPSLLTACEWLDVFVDQQVQIRAGVQKTGVWHLKVEQPGTYRIELRRWPRESQLQLSAGLEPTTVADGQYRRGKPLPIVAANLAIGQHQMVGQPEPDGQSIVFHVELNAGATTLQADFVDSQGLLVCGAYYAYVERLE